MPTGTGDIHDSTARLRQYQLEVRRELAENILPFSIRVVLDPDRGGFYGRVANDRTVDKGAPKGLVQHSRLLWTFAHASRTFGSAIYVPIVDHARSALLGLFSDADHGGFFWMVDVWGRPVETAKFAYGQAFALYALAADYLATGRAESLDLAIDLYRQIEAHCRDPEHGGYWEACNRDWSPAPDLRVDRTDLPVVKGMNSHLHLLEAYAHLLRAWDDKALRQDLQALIDIMLHRILDQSSHHLTLFFDRAWRPLSDAVSYGHDIEASWLLVEAAEVLGDPVWLARAWDAALRMAYVTLEEAAGADGGLFNDGGPSGVTSRNRVWWPQAEAMAGFLNAFQINGDPRFLEASLAAWRFVQTWMVDRVHDEWFDTVDESGHPYDYEKAGPWKTPYHNGRACLEVMARVEALAAGHDAEPGQ